MMLESNNKRMKYVYSKQSPYLGGGVGSGDGGGCFWGGEGGREKSRTQQSWHKSSEVLPIMAKFKVQTSVVQFSFKKKSLLGFGTTR